MGMHCQHEVNGGSFVGSDLLRRLGWQLQGPILTQIVHCHRLEIHHLIRQSSIIAIDSGHILVGISKDKGGGKPLAKDILFILIFAFIHKGAERVAHS